jgi:hypothetical protein
MDAVTVIEIARPTLPILAEPEIQQAIARLRVALEELAEQYAPILDRAKSLPEEAALLQIVDTDTDEFAMAWLRSEQIPTLDAIAESIGPWKKLADKVHSAFVALERLGLDPAKQAREIINAKRRSYAEQVERGRQEAQRRAREEAAAAERCRILEAGPYVFATAVSQVAELLKQDEDRRKAAEEAARRGDAERAEAIKAEVGKNYEPPKTQLELRPIAPTPPPPVVIPEKPKGIAENWRARFTAALEEEAAHVRLIRFVAEHPEWRMLLPVDWSAADKAAKSLKAKLGDVVVGLEGYDAQTVRVGRRR